jgi:hypothetical protein
METTRPCTLTCVSQSAFDSTVRDTPRIRAHVPEPGAFGVESQQHPAGVLEQIPGGDRDRPPVGRHGAHDGRVRPPKKVDDASGRGVEGISKA